eukprot:970002-Rhodomonas_salina.1
MWASAPELVEGVLEGHGHEELHDPLVLHVLLPVPRSNAMPVPRSNAMPVPRSNAMPVQWMLVGREAR